MKTYMPLDGFRWSCDSDSALCDMRQTNVLGRAGGGILLLFLLEKSSVSLPHMIFGGLALQACWPSRSKNITKSVRIPICTTSKDASILGTTLN